MNGPKLCAYLTSVANPPSLASEMTSPHPIVMWYSYMSMLTSAQKSDPKESAARSDPIIL
jgi:hypothetical protein